jgi:hypothetical protein
VLYTSIQTVDSIGSIFNVLIKSPISKTASFEAQTHVWPIDGSAQVLTNQQSPLGHIHPEQQPGRLAARLLAGDPDIKPRHAVTSCRPGNYFHLPQLHRKQCCLTVSICHMLKIDLKTLESNCNRKNYLADSRFVPPIDLLTFPPISGNFLRIQDGSKPMSLEILFYLVPRSRKKASLGTRMGHIQAQTWDVFWLAAGY